MQFTLWPGTKAPDGAHGEISWESFVAFLASPATAASKGELEGWSPARFAGNRRAKAAVELVSAVTLDDDASGLSTDALVALWAGIAGAVHTSFSHTPEVNDRMRARAEEMQRRDAEQRNARDKAADDYLSRRTSGAAQ